MTPEQAVEAVVHAVVAMTEDPTGCPACGELPCSCGIVESARAALPVLRALAADKAEAVEALRNYADWFGLSGENSTDRYERKAQAFYTETGLMAPGKDAPAALGGQDPRERRDRWDQWFESRANAARDCARVFLARHEGTS